MKKLILPISFLVILIAGGFYIHQDQMQKEGSLFSFFGLSSNSLIGTFRCDKGFFSGDEIVLEEGNIIKVLGATAFKYEVKHGYIFYEGGEGGKMAYFKIKDNNTILLYDKHEFRRVSK